MPTSPTGPVRGPVPLVATGPAIDAIARAAAAADLRVDVLVAFAAIVLRREGPTAMVSQPVEGEGPLGSWAAALLDAFAFVDTRPEGTVVARVVGSGRVALDGDRPRGTVIELCCDDRDFLATSLAAELHRLGHRVSRMVRVTFGRTRDGDGRLLTVGPARGRQAETFFEMELERHLDPARADVVVQSLRRVVSDVFRVTDDHAGMRRLVEGAAFRTRDHAHARYPEDEVTESVALAEWLLSGHSVLLATCRFPVVDGAIGPAEERTCLGMLRDADTLTRRAPERIPDTLLAVSRLADISTVHRQVPVQRFDLVLVDDEGLVEGIGRLECVFTQQAEASPVAAIPLLRWKLQRLLELEDAAEGSYDEHAVTALFQALPKDDLFCLDVTDLHRTVRSLLAENRDQRVKVLMRAEPEARAVSVLITMPSELYTRALRERLESFLRAQLDGERVEVELSMGASFDTVARFLVHLAGDTPPPATEGLDAVAREVQLLCRTWEQGLVAALGTAVGDRAPRLAATWADRLPPSYRDAIDPPDAVTDVVDLDDLHAADDRELRVRLTAGPGSEAGQAGHAGRIGPVELSRSRPSSRPRPMGGRRTALAGRWRPPPPPLRQGPAGGDLDVSRDGDRVADAVLALWHGRADIDSLNRLVLRAS
ncbi:MAG: hypothetical protein WKF43_02355 [Acidimicrobiales bacterium]